MTHALTCESASDDARAATHIIQWVFWTILTFGVVLPIALLIWQATVPNAVLRRASVGQFQAATTSSAFLQPPLTTVTTTTGSLTVAGLFSAPHDTPLEVVTHSQTAELELCAVHYPDTCLPLAGAWAGQLQPTPALGRVFDFARHGLTGNTLAFWLFIGCALVLMTGVGWISAVSALEDTEPDASPRLEVDDDPP